MLARSRRVETSPVFDEFVNGRNIGSRNRRWSCKFSLLLFWTQRKSFILPLFCIPIQSNPIQSIPIVIVTRLKLVWNGLRGRCKFRPKQGFFFLSQSFLLSHVSPYRWRGKDFFHPERNIRRVRLMGWPMMQAHQAGSLWNCLFG